MKESVTGCTHCGVCTENCEFLKKYDLTIGDTEKLSKMAYHCFLCGKCSKVNPLGTDFGTFSTEENVPKSVPRGLMDGQ